MVCENRLCVLCPTQLFCAEQLEVGTDDLKVVIGIVLNYAALAMLNRVFTTFHTYTNMIK